MNIRGGNRYRVALFSCHRILLASPRSQGPSSGAIARQKEMEKDAEGRRKWFVSRFPGLGADRSENETLDEE